MENDESANFAEYIDVLKELTGDNSDKEKCIISKGMEILRKDIYKYCMRRTLSIHDGEDLCQEILLNVFKSLKYYVEKLKDQPIDNRKKYIGYIIWSMRNKYFRKEKKYLPIDPIDQAEKKEYESSETKSQNIISFVPLSQITPNEDEDLDSYLAKHALQKLENVTENSAVAKAELVHSLKYLFSLSMYSVSQELFYFHSCYYKSSKLAFSELNGKDTFALFDSMLKIIKNEYGIVLTETDKKYIISILEGRITENEFLNIKDVNAARNVCHRIRLLMREERRHMNLDL